jgi:cell division protein FtsW (lipid II flippase)
MAVTLDQTIAQKQHSFFSRMFASQTFWVVIAVILAFSCRLPPTLLRRRKTSITSPATSRSSPLSRSA